MKLRPYTECVKPGIDGCVNTEGSEHAQAGYMHWCPGCGSAHMIAVERPLLSRDGREIRWTFDGNVDMPTFGPSILIYGGTNYPRCHYSIRNGMIEFCGDSAHGLAGQTVPLPEWPEREDD